MLFFAVSALLVFEPVITLFVVATINWTGCFFSCGPPNRWAGAGLYLLVLAMATLPVLAAVAASKKWLGWLAAALASSVVAAVVYWIVVGVL